MNMTWGFPALFASSIFLFSQISYAAAPLSKEKLEKLISGNTAEGQNTRWEEGMTWYFHKLGQIKKIDQHGNRGKGKWTINEEGELCVEFKRGGERCRTVAPRTDGGYDIYGTEYPEEEELKWIFNQVLPGNPHDLLGFTYCITVLNTKPTGVYAQCPPMTAKPTGRAVSNEIHHFRTS